MVRAHILLLALSTSDSLLQVCRDVSPSIVKMATKTFRAFAPRTQ
jgi:hypothetical protein